MASPLVYNDIVCDPSNEGISISVGGSPLIVLNRNSKAANTYADPWAEAAGSDSNGANVIIVPCNYASYLDLYHIWGNANSPSTAPVVRVWGKLRNRNAGGQDQYSPYDVNQTVFPNSADWWVPLLDPSPPEAATNAYELDMGTANVGTYAAGGTGILLSVPRKVFCGGVERIMVLVQTAGNQTEAGVIAGHFIR